MRLRCANSRDANERKTSQPLRIKIPMKMRGWWKDSMRKTVKIILESKFLPVAARTEALRNCSTPEEKNKKYFLHCIFLKYLNNYFFS